MHSEAATIGEMDHPVAGSTAQEAAIVVVGGAVVGSGPGGDVTTFVLPARGHFARSRSKCEKLPI
jgi:hypothetical protein